MKHRQTHCVFFILFLLIILLAVYVKHYLRESLDRLVMMYCIDLLTYIIKLYIYIYIHNKYSMQIVLHLTVDCLLSGPSREL